MIDWSKQHCGVHQATWAQLCELMPDISNFIKKNPFPENYEDSFIFDVKVHMLMPGQYPCIPNWHYDNVPRVNNKQDFDKVRPDLPMYLWVSNPPLTEFRTSNGNKYLIPEKQWIRFTQCDEHRGTISNCFTWRGFIRATHKHLMPQNKVGHDPMRRHSQVYLDAANFSW